MNPLPERTTQRVVKLIGQMYTAAPGYFPELTGRRIEQDAQALCVAGGVAAVEGHVLLGALAPIRFDRESFEWHFSEARRLAPEATLTWCNEALFSIYFGLCNRVADIVAQHRPKIFDDLDTAVLIFEACSWSCMVNTAIALREFLVKSGKEEPYSELPLDEVARMLQVRGLDERALVERMTVAAQAAISVVGGPMRGFHVIGDETTGYAFEMLFDTDTARIVAAGPAVAGAVTRAFDNDLSDVVTFSAARYLGAIEDGR